MPPLEPPPSRSTVRTGSLLLRARVVLPVSSPPLPDGAVAIRGNRIRAAGRWAELSRHWTGPTLDLGEVALLPGLVNAHCHLDYTGLAGLIPPPRRFTDWLKSILAAKSGLTYSDFAAAWLDGARMLMRTGTTTVADIEAVPELLPEVWTATPLRVFSFLEMTGLKSRLSPGRILGEAIELIQSLPRGRCQAGLSPHAPYSTRPALLKLAAETARRRRLRVTTHVAESAQEFEMFTLARGDMHDWLVRNQRDMSDCGLGTPVQHLERHGALNQRLLAVHVNYLGPEDAALLGRRKVHVVHCPRSHFYFGHQSFPLEELAAARVNVCLGTDSLASVYKKRGRAVELNMFEEMRELARRRPSLSPETILQLATINGARALGLPGMIGEFAPRAFADLIAVPCAGRTAAAYENVLQHRGPVAASMIDGQWVIRPEN